MNGYLSSAKETERKYKKGFPKKLFVKKQVKMFPKTMYKLDQYKIHNNVKKEKFVWFHSFIVQTGSESKQK